MNYDVILPNKELRAYARQQLNGVWLSTAFTFLIYSALFLPFNILSIVDSVCKNLLGESPVSGITSATSIIVLMASGPFALGFAGFFLKRLRGEEVNTKNIFDGFKRFLPSLLLMFFMTLFIVLWFMLLIIPGIIKSISYSMAFFIMYDNPEMKPLEAIKKSQVMMKGYKWKYFLLVLSFIGWFFLCLFTLGIGSLWLTPYMELSKANLYENLKLNQEGALQHDKEPELPFT